MDERNYDYIIRTGFWRKRKGESNGQKMSGGMNE
jgi:hypothetical protein